MRHRSKKPTGSFAQDFERLIAQLATQPVIELGKPLPRQRHLPRKKVGDCPAAHNRALLGGADAGATPSRACEERLLSSDC